MTRTASCLVIEFNPHTFQFRMCAGSIMILRNKSDLEEQSDNTLYQVSSRNCLRECPSEKSNRGHSVRSWHRLLKALRIIIQGLLANAFPSSTFISSARMTCFFRCEGHTSDVVAGKPAIRRLRRGSLLGGSSLFFLRLLTCGIGMIPPRNFVRALTNLVAGLGGALGEAWTATVESAALSLLRGWRRE